MENILSIDDLRPGVTLWFMDTARSNFHVEGFGGDVLDGFIYSAVIESAELIAFTKFESQYLIKFVNSDYDMTFYVGEGDYRNLNQMYLSRHEAVAAAREWNTDCLNEAIEELTKAQKAIEYMREREDAPLVETDYQTSREYGKYISAMKRAMTKGQETE